MRSIHVDEIAEAIKEMCIEANHFLSEDMKSALGEAAKREESPLGRQILGQLEENLAIASEDMIPICQDTGITISWQGSGCALRLRRKGLAAKI